MAVYKCKMCGASIKVEEGQTIVTCEFCGSCQTVHSFDNEKKASFFKRANALRFKNEFDKASSIYEILVSEFPKEAEAYWGLVLCKYGIEYVDDPKTGKKIPTCHRTLFESIFDDSDYKNAVKYADSVAKDVYEKEAQEIADIQKHIIELSSKEDPYDVFICYKETDDRGFRTKDSVLAQDIYKELTEEGYKVFFARISLENKIGTEYEPIIFSALRSSKVMLHVTTSEDNSEAIWVKNEWSRYLNFIKKGDKKILVPIYKDMPAADLPDEMENFQGIDFGKLGALQDLLHGLTKIFKGGKKVEKVKEVVNAQIDDDEDEIYESFIKRGEVFLKAKLFDDAKVTFDKATKVYDKNGRAVLRLMLAQYSCSSFKEFLEDNDIFGSDVASFLDRARENMDSKGEKELEELAKSIDEQKIVNSFTLIDKAVKEKDYRALDGVFDDEQFVLAHKDFFKENLDKHLDYVIKTSTRILDIINLVYYSKFYEMINQDHDNDEPIAKINKAIDNLSNTYNSSNDEYSEIKDVDALKERVKEYISNETLYNENLEIFTTLEEKFQASQNHLLEIINNSYKPIIDNCNVALFLNQLVLMITNSKCRTLDSLCRYVKLRKVALFDQKNAHPHENTKIIIGTILGGIVFLAFVVIIIITLVVNVGRK